ncbi:hypothetical protein HDU67_002862, partial [Dinochytrium kinnereticum]
MSVNVAAMTAKDGVDGASKKTYHAFISYRVKTDSSVSERLCDKLRSEIVEGGEAASAVRDLRFSVFLDVQQLKAGKGYEDQFLEALARSCVVFPIVSEDGLRMLWDVEEGQVDNVLSEWQLALRMMAAGQLEIIPILVGKRYEGAYRKFSAFDTSAFPNVRNEGSNITVKETMETLFKIQ